jgi:hypothetical protein
MFDEIRSALQDVAGGAEKLRDVLSLTDASTKLFRFVSYNVWGSTGSLKSFENGTRAVTCLCLLHMGARQFQPLELAYHTSQVGFQFQLRPPPPSRRNSKSAASLPA